MKTQIVSLAAIAFAAIAIGQSYGGAQPKKPVPSQGIVKVQTVGHSFRPNVIRLKAGKPAQVQLRNGGSAPHNIVFQIPGTDPRVSRNVHPGKTGTVTFRAPSKKGKYRFYCPVGDHAKHGMVGQLIVQ